MAIQDSYHVYKNVSTRFVFTFNFQLKRFLLRESVKFHRGEKFSSGLQSMNIEHVSSPAESSWACNNVEDMS
jgi:hypothetical protein